MYHVHNGSSSPLASFDTLSEAIQYLHRKSNIKTIRSLHQDYTVRNDRGEIQTDKNGFVFVTPTELADEINFWATRTHHFDLSMPHN